MCPSAFDVRCQTCFDDSPRLLFAKRLDCPWPKRRFINPLKGFDIHAAALNLLAFSLGLSRIHAADDHAVLEAAMPWY